MGVQAPTPPRQTPAPEQGALKLSSLPVPVPLISNPSPHAPSLFLGAPSCPFPRAERCQSGEMNVTRASEPLINIAISAAETVHSEVGTVLARPPAGPPAGAQRSLSESLHRALRSGPCRLSPAWGLATRFWRPEFRKVARPHVQRLPAEVRGRQGSARGRMGPGRAGDRQSGPRPPSDSLHFPVPSASQSGSACRVRARKQQTEGEGGWAYAPPQGSPARLWPEDPDSAGLIWTA